MSFADDLDLAQKAEKYQDEIYQLVWPGCTVEDRYRRGEDEETRLLDREFHIDVDIRLPNGARLTGQEKALRNDKASFNTFTIEFYQDRHKKLPGEFFNIACQFYLHGYWNEAEDGLLYWRMIDMLQFSTFVKDWPIEELEKQTRPSTSRANFFYIEYWKLPAVCVYDKSENHEPDVPIIDQQELPF